MTAPGNEPEARPFTPLRMAIERAEDPNYNEAQSMMWSLIAIAHELQEIRKYLVRTARRGG